MNAPAFATGTRQVIKTGGAALAAGTKDPHRQIARTHQALENCHLDHAQLMGKQGSIARGALVLAFIALLGSLPQAVQEEVVSDVAVQSVLGQSKPIAVADAFAHVLTSADGLLEHSSDEAWTRDPDATIRTLREAIGTTVSAAESHGCLDSASGLVSDKVCALARYLTNRESGDGATGVVFVQMRLVALALCDALQRMSILRGVMHPGCLFSCTGGSMEVSMSYQAQKEALRQFREGDTDLLVATDAAEEGIDIPSTSLVVSFDPPPQHKSFVQRRGRARARDATMLLMDPSASDTSPLKASVKAWMDQELQVGQEWRRGGRCSRWVRSGGEEAGAPGGLQRHLLQQCVALSRPVDDARPLTLVLSEFADFAVCEGSGRAVGLGWRVLGVGDLSSWRRGLARAIRSPPQRAHDLGAGRYRPPAHVLLHPLC